MRGWQGTSRSWPAIKAMVALGAAQGTQRNGFCGASAAHGHEILTHTACECGRRWVARKMAVGEGLAEPSPIRKR